MFFRYFNLSLAVIFLASLVVVYNIKNETKTLERQQSALEKEIVIEKDRLALIKAEWAVLKQPEKIKMQLENSPQLQDLIPIEAQQFGEIDNLPFKDEVQYEQDQEGYDNLFSDLKDQLDPEFTASISNVKDNLLEEIAKANAHFDE